MQPRRRTSTACLPLLILGVLEHLSKKRVKIRLTPQSEKYSRQLLTRLALLSSTITTTSRKPNAGCPGRIRYLSSFSQKRSHFSNSWLKLPQPSSMPGVSIYSLKVRFLYSSLENQALENQLLFSRVFKRWWTRVSCRQSISTSLLKQTLSAHSNPSWKSLRKYQGQQWELHRARKMPFLLTISTCQQWSSMVHSHP